MGLDTELEDAPVEEVGEEQDHSQLIGRLRQRREQLGEGRSEVWDVPGYEGELAARYKYVPLDQLGRGSQQLAKVKDPTRRNLLAACDTLVACCDELLIRVHGELRPLSQDGVPIKFGDDRLGKELDFEHKAARQDVIQTFNNEYALMRQAVEVSRWLEGQSNDLDEEFLGE